MKASLEAIQRLILTKIEAKGVFHLSLNVCNYYSVQPTSQLT